MFVVYSLHRSGVSPTSAAGYGSVSNSLILRGSAEPIWRLSGPCLQSPSTLRSALWSALRSALRSALWSAIRSALRSATSTSSTSGSSTSSINYQNCYHQPAAADRWIDSGSWLVMYRLLQCSSLRTVTLKVSVSTIYSSIERAGLPGVFHPDLHIPQPHPGDHRHRLLRHGERQLRQRCSVS